VAASRVLTTFPALYGLRQGIRASFLPALNLSQVSEFSLVLMTLGVAAHHISPDVKNAVSFAFVFLAVLSTFAMMNSAWIARQVVRACKRFGLRDLDDAAAGAGEDHGHGARILLLGFFRGASSLVADLEREDPELLREIAVVDFNPVVFSNLRARGLKVLYGDIAQRETLVHAGVEKAEILISSVPDYLLKGSTNERLVRQLRSLNPKAVIIAPAETLADVDRLYAAGADYALLSRFGEAAELREALAAAMAGHIDQKRTLIDARLADRSEVLA
jgi:voltage-gated potassium channel Kch